MARSPHPDDCRDALRDLEAQRAARIREQDAWPLALAAAAARGKTAGLSVTEIAQLAGVTRATVYSALAALKATGGGA